MEEREKLMRGLVPDIELRYQSLAELAQREVERYKESALKHMVEIVNANIYHF